MKGRRTTLAAVVAATLGAPAMACPAESAGFTRLASPEAEVAYRWEPASPRVGQFVGLEVVACRGPLAAPVEDIAVDATMPAHGHGMNYRPVSQRLATGHFRVQGLMLHMAGHWRLTIDLFQGDTRTRLARDLTLAP
jgi:hypothetical protein